MVLLYRSDAHKTTHFEGAIAIPSLSSPLFKTAFLGEVVYPSNDSSLDCAYNHTAYLTSYLGAIYIPMVGYVSFAFVYLVGFIKANEFLTKSSTENI